ncbi:protein of unknown function (plasmid) [Cupriavidus taiwanensis]|uniref:Uncharacterized protein n=1 Tax=Cupriavidus taiwanensis TaxID=164546 RepID=A0A7Z7JIQ2_9BURK|nr:hypothetical protein CBM2597_U60021 [Cupriavidus taiwanensis]SOZ97287.1 hypothetical protein CBM2598_U60010 [Cupriavidus taiwanensis]SPC26176.1 hypothetical protein CBM2594_U70009 [Cupriavidus taiwanensis]SPD37692.1 protein of unknown function [Cupriavidus taiwanensis]
MIDPSDWKAKRNHCYGHLKLPQDGQAFLAPVIAHLDESLAKLRDAAVCGKLKIDDAIRIDLGGKRHARECGDIARRAIRATPRRTVAWDPARDRQRHAL